MKTIEQARTALVSTLAVKAAMDLANASQVAAVREYLEKSALEYSEHESENVRFFSGRIRVDGDLVNIFNWRIIVENANLLVAVYLPVLVKENLRPAMAEFLSLANFSLKWGKMVMKADDGELMFRLSLPACILNEDNADEYLISSSKMALRRLVPGVMAVLMGKSPKDAYEMGNA